VELKQITDSPEHTRLFKAGFMILNVADATERQPILLMAIVHYFLERCA